MNRKLKWLAVSALLMLMSGCSITPATENSPFYIRLTPVPSSLHGISTLEKFSFSGVVSQSMMVQSELSEAAINLVAMSFEGLPLVQAQWHSHNDTVTTSGSVLAGLNPRLIVHDLQSVMWPTEQLTTALLPGYSISEKQIDVNHRQRQFYFNDLVIRRIEYRDNVVIFNDFRHNYQLKIEQLDSSI